MAGVLPQAHGRFIHCCNRSIYNHTHTETPQGYAVQGGTSHALPQRPTFLSDMHECESCCHKRHATEAAHASIHTQLQRGGTNGDGGVCRLCFCHTNPPHAPQQHMSSHALLEARCILSPPRPVCCTHSDKPPQHHKPPVTQPPSINCKGTVQKALSKHTRIHPV